MQFVPTPYAHELLDAPAVRPRASAGCTAICVSTLFQHMELLISEDMGCEVLWLDGINRESTEEAAGGWLGVPDHKAP